MIKKTTALIFVLLASILVLAHAVIPHHHHQKQICVEKIHCKDDGIAHIQDTAEHNHEHDDNNNSTNCVFQQVVLPSNPGKELFSFVNNTNNQSNFCLFKSIHSDIEGVIPVFRISVYISDISSSYSCYVSASIGLRAPPAC